MILRRAIELVGGTVMHFVPDRLLDGYGLQPATVERLAAAGARVRDLPITAERVLRAITKADIKV